MLGRINISNKMRFITLTVVSFPPLLLVLATRLRHPPLFASLPDQENLFIRCLDKLDPI